MKHESSLALLERGRVEVLGVLPYASNYTFLARVCDRSEEVLAVYKPSRGERPLWDFPEGSLARREVAAYLLSEAGGFAFVPPTVLHDDAPMGVGSVQLFVDHDPERHFFTLIEERPQDFAGFAAFDVVVNNADRKAGHVLEDTSGKLWSVDHGLTFHAEYKLRTVIWEYAEGPLPPDLAAGLEGLSGALSTELGARLAELLSRREADATAARLETLLAEGRFPAPRGLHPLPWPLV
ncbi:MAG: SCO1664 family protein [Actinomycetota bacterium]